MYGFRFQVSIKNLLPFDGEKYESIWKYIIKKIDHPEGRGRASAPIFSEKLNLGMFSKFLCHFVVYDQ